MSELEDRLHHILSDPQELERISRLAAQLMEGGPAKPGTDTDAGRGAASGTDAGGSTDGGAGGGSDAGLLSGLKALFPGAGGGGGDKGALLQALAPYLQPERQAKLERALRLARLARIAGSALGDPGGGNV
jgi:hypothetical protein